MALTKKDFDAVVRILDRKSHLDLFDRDVSTVIEGMSRTKGISVDALEGLFTQIKNKRASGHLDELAKAFERGEMNWLEASGVKAAGKAVTNAAHTVALKPAKWALGKTVGLTKIAGIGAAALVGAGILSSLLSSKRQESAERLANEPAQMAQPDFNQNFGPSAYTGNITGSVPPVEGEWVAKTRGGDMNRAAVPSTPDVALASRAEAIEQSRAIDAGSKLQAV